MTEGLTHPEAAFLGEFEILKELSPGHTFLAVDPADRVVVLKRLDDDCLADGGVHPSIRERLQRIQEIPHIGVANLHGAELLDGHVYLVWQFIKGTPLEMYLTTADMRGRLPDLAEVGRELVMSVEALSRLGIVHGALHGGNIIVTPDRAIRLTHLSPYLYTDPQEDAQAVIDLLLDSLNKRYQPGDLPTHRLLTRAHEEGYDLGRLTPLLACPPDSPLSPMQMSPKRVRKRERRRKSILLALLLLLVGGMLAGAVLYRLGYFAALSLPVIQETARNAWEWLKGLPQRLH
ncbi:MAG TPA: protein kinase [Tepidisphaeraceae bacterium]|jgi:tRNA A-37 threonylcarbamoyl transferase component Bud32|nr:protein kinase [Tepidisphaeraceae bacterium]